MIWSFYQRNFYVSSRDSRTKCCPNNNNELCFIFDPETSPLFWNCNCWLITCHDYHFLSFFDCSDKVRSVATLFMDERLNIFFSSLLRAVSCMALILVKLDSLVFLPFIFLLGVWQLTPVAASMSRSISGSLFSGGLTGFPLLSLAMTWPWSGHFTRSFLGHKRPLGKGARQVHFTSSNVSER